MTTFRTLMLISLTALALAVLPATAQDGDNGGFTGVNTTPPATAKPAAPAGDGTATPADGQAKPGDEGQPAGEGEQARQPFDMKFMFILVGAMVLMFWFSGRKRKKQQRERQEMLASMKKGDKVISIGGICGTVAEVREDEIVVKISDNTRMTFIRSAIRSAGESVAEDKKEDAQQG